MVFFKCKNDIKQNQRLETMKNNAMYSKEAIKAKFEDNILNKKQQLEV